MGQDRRQEGLGAYEAIKKINPETRIWVFSAFPEYEKLTKKLTKNLTGNEEDIFIEKTTNLKEDIRQKLVPKILECR
ncbi:MAG: hypothetical protein ACRDEA_22045, partial [Microcystaceae cyanobacterium]